MVVSRLVSTCHPDAWVSCIWFDKKDRYQREEFNINVLQFATSYTFFPMPTYPPTQPFRLDPYVPPVFNDGTYKVTCQNASSQADGCTDPGDVHQ